MVIELVRSAPRKLYLDLEAQPASTAPKAESELKPNSRSTPTSESTMEPAIRIVWSPHSNTIGPNHGITQGERNTMANGMAGATRNRILFTPDGANCSLKNSLVPSHMFCT